MERVEGLTLVRVAWTCSAHPSRWDDGAARGLIAPEDFCAAADVALAPGPVVS